MDAEIDDEFPIEIDVGNIGDRFSIEKPDTTVYETEQVIDIDPVE